MEIDHRDPLPRNIHLEHDPVRLVKKLADISAEELAFARILASFRKTLQCVDLLVETDQPALGIQRGALLNIPGGAANSALRFRVTTTS